MANEYFRKCPGIAMFNTGISRCPIDPGKVKGLIFAQRGVKLPVELTLENLEKAFHADRPNRLYPIKTVDEYAPSGGEAQTSAQGYGATKVTGYSARTDSFTLSDYDVTLKTNVVEAKDVQFDVYIIDDNNVIWGDKDTDGSLKGIELSGISVGGQDFDSSGQQANLIINIMYKDIERHWKIQDYRQVDFDILSILNGIVFVDVKMIENNKYKIIEHNGKLDVTPYVGEKLSGGNATKCWDTGVTAVSYADGFLAITVTDSATPHLKKPSVLQENGVTGIEEYTE